MFFLSFSFTIMVVQYSIIHVTYYTVLKSSAQSHENNTKQTNEQLLWQRFTK